jgi:hypothetical protein
MRFGMAMTTRVKKADLLKTLKENRDRHQGIFEEALVGYRKEMEATLEQALEMIRAGKRIVRRIHLPVPTNETASYDTAIRMLEMGTEDVIELSAQDFACLVEDKWEWRDAFLTSNSDYSETARVMAAQADG